MIETSMSRRGMVTSPHHLASQAGLAVLRQGGNAVEAAVATAAAIAVAYPHMTGLGGDGFWLIAEPGKPPVAVAAAGPAAAAATLDRYRGAPTIPTRGPAAALTVPGTVDGWRQALAVAAGWGPALPLPALLADAVALAADGIAVTRTQAANSAAKLAELRDQPGFAGLYLVDGAAPSAGARLRNPHLADMLRRLGEAGLDDFYRGDVGVALAADLAAADSPLARADLEGYRAELVAPLSVNLPCGTAYNLPPPTQGFASLMILGMFCRLGVDRADGFAYVHGLVEATKRAFLVRDAELADPRAMRIDPRAYLTTDVLAEAAADIDPRRALAWPARPDGGDTIWLGVIDGAGRAVSMIQSLYWEFGSGVVSPSTGIVLQNRGAGFDLDPGSPNCLAPGRVPRHTLNPAFARLKDGRTLVYGCMGGDGQPQTQAALFTRYALFGQPLQAAVDAPRWLLGRSWGDQSVTLKLEDRFDARLLDGLRAAGHDVVTIAPYAELCGHAGAIARHDGGLLEGAADPRSDGAVAAF